MKVLAVDTVSRSCSVSIVEEQSVVSEVSLSIKQTHARHLMGMIETALRISGISPQAVDGYAVSTGPGSFTGMRIGISTVKGLAHASGKPAVGISSLDALSHAVCHTDRLICAMLDARRGEVYYACYKCQDNQVRKLIPEQAASPDRVVQHIHEPCILVGDGADAYCSIFEEKLGSFAHFSDSAQNFVRASIVGKLGFEKLKNTGWKTEADLTPCYLRKCDAEVHFNG